MLKQVRGALKTVVAAFVSLLLILAFAAWGVPEMRTFVQRAPLKVGRDAFSAQTIQTEYNRMLNARRRQEGGKFTQEQAVAEGLPDQVVDSIATRSVLRQEAKKMGVAAPMQLVRTYLQSIDQFKNPVTGKFDETTLRSILANNNLTAAQFQSMIQEDLIRDQLIGSVAAGPPVSMPFANALILREIERRKVAYLTITADMAGKPAEPTPDALKSYYEAHKDSFMAPEYRTFTVVEVKASDFAKKIAAPEEELRKAYEANKARLYETPETRTLYQFNYADEAAAKAAADELRNGKPVADIAAEKHMTLKEATFTDISRDAILDKAVADAAFSDKLKDGDVAGPIKGMFGYTVVKLVSVKPAETKSFDEVKDELAKQYTAQDAKKQVFDTVEKIEDGRDTGEPMVKAAEDIGLKPVQYGPVDSASLASGGGIVPDIPAEVLAEAFKIQEGEESEATALADDAGYFFVQVDEVRPPKLRPYDEVADLVQSRWRAEEQKNRIADAVRHVVDAVRSGKSLSDAASPFNRVALEKILARNASDPAFSPDLVRKIFLTSKGDVVAGSAGGSTDAQTIAVIEDIGFARSQIGPGEEEAFARYVGERYNQEILEAYVESLRKEYGVKVNKAALTQIFNEQP